jgi:hypothetical protein
VLEVKLLGRRLLSQPREPLVFLSNLVPFMHHLRDLFTQAIPIVRQLLVLSGELGHLLLEFLSLLLGDCALLFPCDVLGPQLTKLSKQPPPADATAQHQSTTHDRADHTPPQHPPPPLR